MGGETVEPYASYARRALSDLVNQAWDITAHRDHLFDQLQTVEAEKAELLEKHVELIRRCRNLEAENTELRTGRSRVPAPEPARRGRVVNASELREGDMIDTWNPSGEKVNDGVAVKDPDYWGGWSFREEIRLVSRKPPEPSEHPVILAWALSGLEGEYFKEPHAMIWEGGYYSNSNHDVVPDRVMDWIPARVVPAGQEG